MMKISLREHPRFFYLQLHTTLRNSRPSSVWIHPGCQTVVAVEFEDLIGGMQTPFIVIIINRAEGDDDSYSHIHRSNVGCYPVGGSVD